MKTVFLVRHAKSSWKDTSLDDIDRPLNKRGQRDAPFMGKLLRGRGVVPDRLISSPANRALTTAQHFAKAFGMDKGSVLVEESLYESYPDAIQSLIQGLDGELKTVLLFSHNPTLTTFVNRYASDYIANVPTCGIVQLESRVDQWSDFAPDTAKVKAFYYPKQYFT